MTDTKIAKHVFWFFVTSELERGKAYLDDVSLTKSTLLWIMT